MSISKIVKLPAPTRNPPAPPTYPPSLAPIVAPIYDLFNACNSDQL